MDRPAEIELGLASGEFVDNVAGIWKRPGKPIQLGHHKGVAGAAGRQCLTEAGPGAVRAGSATVDVDPPGSDPQCGKGVALGGEVLGLS